MAKVNENAISRAAAIHEAERFVTAAAREKLELNKCFGDYKKYAKRLEKAALVSMKAQRKFNLRPTLAKQRKLDSKKAILVKHVKAYNSAAEKVNVISDRIHDNYQKAKEIVFDVDMKKGTAIVKKFDKFNEQLTNRINKIQDPLLILDIPSIDE